MSMMSLEEPLVTLHVKVAQTTNAEYYNASGAPVLSILSLHSVSARFYLKSSSQEGMAAAIQRLPGKLTTC